MKRVDYGEIPPRVDYSLTAFGHTLARALAPLCQWGTEHTRETSGWSPDAPGAPESPEGRPAGQHPGQEAQQLRCGLNYRTAQAPPAATFAQVAVSKLRAKVGRHVAHSQAALGVLVVRCEYWLGAVRPGDRPADRSSCDWRTGFEDGGDETAVHVAHDLVVRIEHHTIGLQLVCEPTQ